jgi:lysophospholipase L1-like esterase
LVRPPDGKPCQFTDFVFNFANTKFPQMKDQNPLMRHRRDFLKKAAIGSLAALSLPGIVKAGTLSQKQRRISLSGNETILFQGDSITDAGRTREVLESNHPRGLGSGYAMLASASLLHKRPGMNLSIYNKGISGNKVYQLAERWDADTLALKPNILSILIGVNDYWHTKRDYKGTVETYRSDYRELLERTQKALPGVKLIIGEPFAIPGVKAVDETWYPDFDGYRAAAKEMADTFSAVFIPYQSIFNQAMKSAPGAYWAHDGVHPSLAGAQLMAIAWLNAVK